MGGQVKGNLTPVQIRTNINDAVRFQSPAVAIKFEKIDYVGISQRLGVPISSLTLSQLGLSLAQLDLLAKRGYPPNMTVLEFANRYVTDRANNLPAVQALRKDAQKWIDQNIPKGIQKILFVVGGAGAFATGALAIPFNYKIDLGMSGSLTIAGSVGLGRAGQEVTFTYVNKNNDFQINLNGTLNRGDDRIWVGVTWLR
jgi:hypothetical protein